MKENIKNINNRGLLHGYQERYFKSELAFRGYKKNHNNIGYFEKHGSKLTEYHIR